MRFIKQSSTAVKAHFAERERPDMAEWIAGYHKSPDYRSKILQYAKRKAAFTGIEETAMISSLIEKARPKWCLEIGTFFADTTRIMAEALIQGIPVPEAKLITLDPFGEHRVPGILAGWPQKTRDVVEYHPLSSMDFFLRLETDNSPKGMESPLEFVFVDGHHNFEYALFDLIRSADHLKPEGIMVVDNLEQEGPRTALREFLKLNPAWKAFFGNGSWNTHQEKDDDNWPEEAYWCALFSPVGKQISNLSTKLCKRHLPYHALTGLEFNVAHITTPGTLYYNLLYCAIPYDYHITGKGYMQKRVTGSCSLNTGAPFKERFKEPLSLDITHPQTTNVTYELELRYVAEVDKAAYIMLDANNPVTLLKAE